MEYYIERIFEKTLRRRKEIPSVKTYVYYQVVFFVLDLILLVSW